MDPFVSFYHEQDVELEGLDSEEIQKIAMDATTILQQYTSADPMAKLNEHYQKKGEGSVSKCFRVKLHREGAGKESSTFWRYTFQCPLVGTEVTSSVALALLHGDQPIGGDLAEISHKLFGEHLVVDGGVFFRTKKGAKKAAAVVMLRELQGTNVETNKNLEKESEQENTKKSEQEKPVATKPFKMRKLPDWVHQLYDAGVRAVKISYREQRKKNDIWKGQPTLLICTMSISDPIALQISSLPSSSKEETRHDAVIRLMTQLDRLCPDGKRTTEHLFDIVAIMEEKQELFNCDDPSCNYVFPLPTLARRPIYLKELGPIGYAYELIVNSATGNLAACEKLALTENETTRFGVFFAEDIEPTSTRLGQRLKVAGYSAPFRFKGGSNQEFTVELRNRTVITIDSMGGTKGSFERRLAEIKKFNKTVARWKLYGFASESVGKKKKMDDALETNESYFARQYLFVPIARESEKSLLSIDWDLLQDVTENKLVPYLTPSPHKMYFPLVGDIGLVEILMGVVYGIAVFAILTMGENVPIVWSQETTSAHSPRGLAFATVWVLLLLILVYLSLKPPFKRDYTATALKNRFLRHRAGLKALYVPSVYPNMRLTSLARFKSREALASMTVRDVEYNEEHFGLNMRKATFVNYYRQKYGVRIRHPQKRLVGAYNVKKQTDFNPFDKTTAPEAFRTYLIPELIDVLPVPRDVLYILGMAERFMPALEREILVAAGGQKLCDMAVRTQFLLTNALSSGAIDTDIVLQTKHRRRPLCDLLAEATTLHPAVSYQRLEFLGDAVLGYFLALNAYAKNSSLRWDCEDISQICGEAGRNVTLFDGAMRAGLNRLLHAGSSPWRSSLAPEGQQRRKGKTTLQPLEEKSLFGYCDEGQVFPIAGSSLSDAVESLLAVSYLHGMAGADFTTGGLMVAVLLELVALPFPESEDNDAVSWLRARGPCLKGGYPFEKDPSWERRLATTSATIKEEPSVQKGLEENFQSLLNTFGGWISVSSINNRLKTESSKTLLLTALFDDSLDKPLEHSEQATNDRDQEANKNPFKKMVSMLDNRLRKKEEQKSVDTDETEGLYAVALLRDTLFHIGCNALDLVVKEEIFRMYPDATVGDLHLLRTCALTEDVVVYIMMKWNIDDCLLDTTASCREKFKDAMDTADKIGGAVWEQRGGWILQGGAASFRRRRLKHFWRNAKVEDLPDCVPMYPGLAGGRLYGQISKLSEETTGDLQFSFNCIAGALVLALGTDGMWCCLRPLFEEVLVMAPEELREEYKDVSSICRVYSQGKKDNAAKISKFGIVA